MIYYIIFFNFKSLFYNFLIRYDFVFFLELGDSLDFEDKIYLFIFLLM